MKNILAILIMAVMAFFAPQLGSWYLIAAAGFIGGIVIRKTGLAFILAFTVVSTIWFIQMQLLVDASPSDLPDRMGKLIGVGSGFTLMIVSSLIGGLVAGCAAAAGGVLTKKSKNRRR